MLKFFYYIKGYLLIEVTAGCLERFMNLCANKNILLWDIKRIEHGYRMCISLKSFWEIHKIVRKSGVRVVIQKRIGLPFFIPKIKKRWLYFITIVALLFVFILSQQFIWSIHYTGFDKVTVEEVERFLEHENIRRGTPVKQIQGSELEKEIRNEFSEVTWVTVYITGTSLWIEVKENDKIILDENAADDNITNEAISLYATQKGKIQSIITRSGVPKVKVGDEVEPGTLLVEGILDILDNDGNVKERKPVISDADIFIVTTKKKQFEVESTLKKYIPTKKSKNYYCLYFNDELHVLQFFKVPFEKYTIQENVFVQSDSQWPFSFKAGVLTAQEVQEQLSEKPEKIYEKEFSDMLSQYIQSLEEKSVQIIAKNVNIKKGTNKIVMTVNLRLSGPFYKQKRIAVLQDNAETQSE